MKGTTIELKLFGRLAELFGQTHKLFVQTPGEALRLMAVNYAGFSQALQEEPELFLIVDEQPRGIHAIESGVSGTVALVPVEEGRKEGYQTALAIAGVLFVGALTMGVAFGVSGASGFMGVGTTGFAATLTNSMLYMSIGYALSAAVAYATRNDNVTDSDTRTQQLGSTFSGPINATQTGLPVPVGYGRLRVGSFQLSASISPIDRPDLLAQGL